MKLTPLLRAAVAGRTADSGTVEVEVEVEGLNPAGGRDSSARGCCGASPDPAATPVTCMGLVGCDTVPVRVACLALAYASGLMRET
jgi:hypothetical protein